MIDDVTIKAICMDQKMDLLNTVPIFVQQADPHSVPDYLKGEPIGEDTNCPCGQVTAIYGSGVDPVEQCDYCSRDKKETVEEIETFLASIGFVETTKDDEPDEKAEDDEDEDVLRCTTCVCGNCTAAPGVDPSEECCFCSDENNKTDDDKKFASFLGMIGLWNDSLLVQNKAQKLKVGLRYINDGLFSINPATFVGPVAYGQDLCGHYFVALHLRRREQKAVQAPDWFNKKDHKYLEAPIVTLVMAQRNYYGRQTSVWVITTTPALGEQYINAEDVVGPNEKQIHGDVRTFCHFDLLKMLLNDKHPTLCLCPSVFVVPNEDDCVVQTLID
jgi:hypothetical protein